MKNLKYTLALAMVFTISLVLAQKQSFRILDEEGHSLIGVTYIYDTQKGLSDTDGMINFEWVANADMHLSYLGYGKWTMNEIQIKNAIENGHTIRQSVQKELQPVTILSVRPKMDEEEDILLDFQQQMEHDGGALLSRIPTINGIRKGGNYGFDPVLRGFKYDQVNIVMNGTQCATAACPNRMDPPTSQMAPNMLEKIEIFKGPYAMRYGGGLGGTINFVTGSPTFNADENVYGRLSGRYDSNGEVLKSEAKIGLAGNSYDIGLFGSWAEGNDYQDGEDRVIPADFSRSSVGVNSAFKLSDQQTFELSAFFNKANDVDFPALMMDLRSDETLMLNTRHEIKFAHSKWDSWTTTLFLSSVDHLMDNKLKPLDPRMMNASTDARTMNYGGRTEFKRTDGHKKLFVGFDFKLEDAQGIRSREFLLGPMAGKTLTDNAWQHGKIEKFGLFGEYNLRLSDWQVVLAGRLEVNQASVLDADPSFLEEYEDTDVTQFNPNLSVGALKEFKEGMTFGIWVARAQRSASLAERYINKFSIGQDPYELIGNPDLNAEVNNQLDLTFEWKTAKSLFNIDFFGAYMQDFISSVIDLSVPKLLPNTPGVRRFVNIDKAYKLGFEASYRQNLTSWMDTDIAVAYTWAKDVERNEPLPEIAPLDLRFNINGSLWSNRFTPRVGLRYVSDQNRISTEYGESTTPGFTVLDVDMAYAISKHLRIELGVDNILNEVYYEHLSRSTAGGNPLPLNAQGRNYYVSFGYTMP